MKKIMAVLFVFLVLFNGFEKTNNFSLLDYFSGEYTAYTASSSGENCVDLGFCYINSKPVTKDLVGESIVVKDLEIASAIKTLNAKVIKTEYLDNGTTVIYAYTNLINNNVKVEGKRVNLQIAIKDEVTVLGWPLILGSF